MVLTGIFFGVLMFSLFGHATPQVDNVWEVEPDTCLIDESETGCVIQVRITLLNQAQHNPCVYIEKSRQTCFANETTQTTITVNLTANTVLYLRGESGAVLATHELVLSTLHTADFKQRVRLPWSLF